MANKITGSTDTGGTLSVIPALPKCVLIVGTQGSGASEDYELKTIYDITSTATAGDLFGTSSVTVQMVRTLIQNGVDNIKGIAIGTSGSVTVSLADALEESLKEKTIKCIVTDTNASATITALKTHLASAESNDLFRYAFVAPTVANTDTQEHILSFAATVADDRIFVPAPAIVDNDGTPVDPQVTASALAAIVMTETDDPALPINSVGILGFSGLNRTLLTSEMGALVAGGVTPLYAESAEYTAPAVPTVYRLVTSNTSDAVWKEGTTRFIADYVLESVETLLRRNYKRTKNVVRILNAIKDDVIFVLKDCEAKEIIENFDPSTVSVSRDPADAYGALVDYEFDVITPLYTITITQHMKL